MRWTRGHRSDQVEDRRAFGGGGGGMSAAGIGVLGWLFSRFGLPGLLIGGAVLYFMSGGLGGGGGSESAPADPSRGVSSSPAEDEAVQFVSFVLDDAQSTWTETFARERPALSARAAGAVSRAHAVGLRHGQRGDRARSTARPTSACTSIWASTASSSSASARPATSRRPT